MRFLLLVVSLLGNLFVTISAAQSVQGPVDARNFQNVNVCPAGQGSPKPCSRRAKWSTTSWPLLRSEPTNVVTQGAPHLDFSLKETTCKGTIQAGSSCYVRVAFAPRAPGVRMGAVQLTDSSGNLLASTYIYGNGQGPAAAFNPGVSKNLPVSGYNGSTPWPQMPPAMSTSLLTAAWPSLILEPERKPW